MDAEPSLDDLAAELLAGLRAQIPATGFRLEEIEIEVGALLDLDPEALIAAMQPHLPGVIIRVARVDALLQCTRCGAHYPPDEHPCPVCGAPEADWVHGRELQISRARGTAQ